MDENELEHSTAQHNGCPYFIRISTSSAVSVEFVTQIYLLRPNEERKKICFKQIYTVKICFFVVCARALFNSTT